MTWRKIPHFPKWAGYEGGHHVATVHHYAVDLGPAEWRIWVDGGRGFQQLQNPVPIHYETRQVKGIAEAAYRELVRRLVVDVKIQEERA